MTRMTYDTTNPNGLLVSPDDEWLYVAQYDNRTSFVVMLFDDYSRLPTKALRLGKLIPREWLSIDTEKNLELRKYPIEGDELAEYEILYDFAPHRPIDGMCLDADGNIVAPAGSEEGGPGPMIYVFSPQGEVLETHPSPPRPTNCVFGDSDLRTLYLTNSEGSSTEHGPTAKGSWTHLTNTEFQRLYLGGYRHSPKQTTETGCWLYPLN